MTNSHQVTHSQQVLTKLEEVLSQIKDAETGQRGYIITGEESYLEPYRLARITIEQEIEDLNNLTATNPNQNQRLNPLKLLIAKKLAELKLTIDLRRDRGFDVASRVVLTNEGKHLMDKIRNVIREMENEEKRSLKERSRLAQISARDAIVTFSGGICLTFVILAAVYYQIYQEIVERKRAESLLEQERDFTSSILDTSGALVIVLDIEGKIVRFNKACEQTTGYLFAEVKGKHFWDLFLIPEEVEPVKEVFNLLRSGDFPNYYENYWLTRNGDRRSISWSNTSLCDRDGAVEYIIGIGIDITERKLVQEAMQRQLAAVEAAIDGIALCDREGRYTYLNQAHAQIFGYDDAQQLIGKTWRELYYPDEIARIEGEIFPILGQHRHWQGEATGKRKDGSTFAEEVSLTLLEDGSIICVCRDISKRKQAEEELYQKNIALENAVEGIARLDVQGRYLAVNKAYASMLARQPEEMLAQEWQTTVHPEDCQTMMAAYQDMLAHGKAEAEVRGVRKDGSIFYKQVTMISARNKQQEFIGHYCFMKDISDRKQLEAELQARIDGVQAAQKIWKNHQIPIVYLTANSDLSTVERAKITEPFGYITKPFKEKDLHTAVEIALHRYQIEKKLKEREQWLNTILVSLGDAVIATDARNCVTLLNPVAEALTGWKQAEAFGRNATEVFRIAHEETRGQIACPIDKALQSGEVVFLPEKTILIAKNGAEIPIDDSAAPIKDERGAIEGAVAVFRDITERKRDRRRHAQSQ